MQNTNTYAQSYSNQAYTNQPYGNQAYANQSYANQTYANQYYTNQAYTAQSYAQPAEERYIPIQESAYQPHYSAPKAKVPGRAGAIARLIMMYLIAGFGVIAGIINLFTSDADFGYRFLDSLNSRGVGVNFDPANFLINGRANPSDAMDRLAFLTYGFHAKDGLYATGFDPKGREVQIGQGQVDFACLLQKLKDAGFDGDLTIEREIPEGPQRDREILEEKAYLEAILEKLN